MAGKDEWELCWQDRSNAWSMHPCFNGTDSLYTDEEKEIIAQVAVMIAQYECFKHYFHETCYELYGQDNDDYYTK